MAGYKVEICGVNTAKLPLLTNEESLVLSVIQRFSTYAVPMILGEVHRYLRDNNAIRVSRSLRDIAYKAIYAKEGLMRKNSREPTIMEAAEEIHISQAQVSRLEKNALKAMRNYLN